MQYLNRWDNNKKKWLCTVMFFTEIVKGLPLEIVLGWILMISVERH
jgi:hypothetical protein